MKFLSLCVLLLSFSAHAFKVKFGTVAPVGTPWAQTLEDISKQVNKDSKGKIKIKTYLGGQLGGELQILQKIRRGNIQGGGLTCGALASVIPELDVLELPYLFESYEEVDYILDNHLLKPFTKLFDDKGFVLVSWAENGWRHIGHKSKKVIAPADLSGQKMRSQESRVHLAFWKKLNASPQAISTAEALSALQTGVVTGFDNTSLFTLAAEWHTAIKHFSLTGHIYQPAAVVYSKKFWEQRSEEEKKILMGEGNGMAPGSRVAVRALGDELLEVLRSQDIQVHKLTESQKDAFKKELLPLHEKLVNEIGGDAKKIYDLIQKAKKEFANK